MKDLEILGLLVACVSFTEERLLLHHIFNSFLPLNPC